MNTPSLAEVTRVGHLMLEAGVNFTDFRILDALDALLDEEGLPGVEEVWESVHPIIVTTYLDGDDEWGSEDWRNAAYDALRAIGVEFPE